MRRKLIVFVLSIMLMLFMLFLYQSYGKVNADKTINNMQGYDLWLEQHPITDTVPGTFVR